MEPREPAVQRWGEFAYEEFDVLASALKAYRPSDAEHSYWAHLLETMAIALEHRVIEPEPKGSAWREFLNREAVALRAAAGR